jgi:hypothetical protein
MLFEYIPIYLDRWAPLSMLSPSKKVQIFDILGIDIISVEAQDFVPLQKIIILIVFTIY